MVPHTQIVTDGKREQKRGDLALLAAGDEQDNEQTKRVQGEERRRQNAGRLDDLVNSFSSVSHPPKTHSHVIPQTSNSTIRLSLSLGNALPPWEAMTLSSSRSRGLPSSANPYYCRVSRHPPVEVDIEVIRTISLSIIPD